jgi:hypothetical protein
LVSSSSVTDKDDLQGYGAAAADSGHRTAVSGQVRW